jgi:hypothetical protein
MSASSPDEALALSAEASNARVLLARHAVVAAIRARESYVRQLELANCYCTAIVDLARATRRHLPVPSAAAVLRCFT